MQVYIPKDIIKFLDQHKDVKHSRESLIVKMLGHLIDEGVDMNNVKQRGKSKNDNKNGALQEP